jgi:hypothetical protein
VTAPAGATTGAQNTFWRKLRQHVDGLPERFTPGKYRCPAHDDKGKSLKVGYRDNHVTLHCFSHNCSRQAVMDRIGARWGDMSDYGPMVGGKLLGTFTYTDERGAEVLRAHRYTDPPGVRYEHYRPDGWVFDSAARGPHVLYRLPEVVAAVEAEERVFVVDSEQAADALHAAGVVATTAAYRPPGKPWKPEYVDRLHGAYVTVVARKSEAGRRDARLLAGLLLDGGAADVQLVEPATAKRSADAADHLAAGFGPDQLAPLYVEGTASASGVVEGEAGIGSGISGTEPRRTLAEVETAFRAHHEHGDLVALRATLACYAANLHLDGDPVWLGLVSGSSTGKTETALALARTPGVMVASTLTGEAALLSGTAEKDRAAGATGGLLRQLGDRGLLVLKDFTTVLSMHPDKRGAILSALREVYDGRWSRDVGTSGGVRLEWRGKLGLVVCSTTAYDRAHAVIAVMGDRFLLVRLDDDERRDGTRAALRAAGREGQARAAIADAVAGLLGHAPASRALDADGDDLDRFAMLADFVTLARSPVARDYHGEIDLVLDPEGPYRFAKQLYGLWRACGLLGLDRPAAWEVAARVARDSMPRLRWRALAALTSHGGQSTNTVARAARHPYRSTRRALEDLVAHGVAERFSVTGQGEDGKQDRWLLTEQHRTAAELLLIGSVPEISDPPPRDEPGTLLDPDDSGRLAQ